MRCVAQTRNRFPVVRPILQVHYSARYKSDANSNTKTYIPQPTAKVRRPKTKEEIAKEKHEKALQSPYRLVRWAAIASSEKFNKSMTKYMVGIYAIFLIYGVYFSKKLFQKRKNSKNWRKRPRPAVLMNMRA